MTHVEVSGTMGWDIQTPLSPLLWVLSRGQLLWLGARLFFWEGASDGGSAPVTWVGRQVSWGVAMD